jgi:hypothetical protein
MVSPPQPCIFLMDIFNCSINLSRFSHFIILGFQIFHSARLMPPPPPTYLVPGLKGHLPHVEQGEQFRPPLADHHHIFLLHAGQSRKEIRSAEICVRHVHVLPVLTSSALRTQSRRTGEKAVRRDRLQATEIHCCKRNYFKTTLQINALYDCV